MTQQLNWQVANVNAFEDIYLMARLLFLLFFVALLVFITSYGNTQLTV